MGIFRRRDVTQRLRPVLADEPLVGRHLRGRLRTVTVLWLTAGVIVVLLVATIAHRVTELNAQVDARRHVRDRQAAVTQLQVDGLRRRVDVLSAGMEGQRRELCALLVAAPPDPHLDAVRVAQGCGPRVGPVPSVTPGVSWSPVPSTAVRPPTSRVHPPSHRPTPSPSARPAPSPSRGPACLPILGCIN